jgi:hypothetical protein
MLPRWMSWLVLIFIGYALASADFSAAPERTPDAATPEASYPTIAKMVDKERWLSGINPDHVGPPRWREVTPGEGDGAVCGGTITVKMLGLKHTPETPRELKLGNAPYDALNTMLLGLKPGGVREIALPASDIDKKAKTGMAIFTVERVDGVAAVNDTETAPAQPRAK